MTANGTDGTTCAKPPTSVFELGRMRHLDLLATWHQYTPAPATNKAACKQAA